MEVDERDSAPSLTSWLDVMAPSYARLYLRRGSPLWYAVHDLRAAMILDSWGDSSSDDWTHEDGIRWRAPRTLESCGILLPEALYWRVWHICRESVGVPPLAAAHDDDDNWARWWLLDAARAALRYGPQEATRRRYGCEPDAELMR